MKSTIYRSGTVLLLYLLFVVIATAMAAFCAAQDGPPKSPTSSAKPVTGAEAEYAKQAFVQEELKTSVRFESDGTGRRHSTGRYRVESEAGVQQLGLIRIGYNTAFERVTIDYLRVIKPDGKVIAVASDAVQDLPSEMQRLAPMYTDFREKHINVPALRPGDRLEYSFTTDVHTAMIAGQFWLEYSFEKNTITLDEELQLDVPAERALKLKSGFTPKIEEEKGRKIYRWSHKNLKNPEPQLPGDDEPKVPDVQVSSFRDWAEVAKWYAGLQAPRGEVTPAIRAKAEELTKGLGTESEKIEAIYGFVASRIRYLGLSFGSGRFEPHSAEAVLQNTYGDCKDKQTLLTALLAAIGVKSEAVLIGPERKLDAEVPSPGQFSHLIGIVKARTGEVYADTTTEVAPLGYLIPPLRKKQALRVGGDGGALVTTPADPPTMTMERIAVNGKLDEAGKLEATVTLRAEGDTEVLWRTILRRTSEAQWPQIFKVTFGSLGLPGEVSEVHSSDASDARTPLEVTMHVSKADYVDWKAAKSLPLPLVQMAEKPAATPEQRKDPIRIGVHNIVRELRLELPAAKEALLPPSDEEAHEDFANYRATYKMSQTAHGALLTARREYLCKTGEVPRARYKDFNKIYDALSADEAKEAQFLRFASRSSLVMKADATAGVANGSANELLNSALKAWNAGDADKAERQLQAVVKQDSKHPQAWLALARLYMRKSFAGNAYGEKAMEAYRNALEVDPKNEKALHEFAFLLFREGRLLETAEVTKRVLEINPQAKGMNELLGMSYLWAGRPAEAVEPLEREVGDPAVGLMLARAYLQSGATDKGMRIVEPILSNGGALAKAEAATVLADAGVNLEEAEEGAASAMKMAYDTLLRADFATVESDERTAKVLLIWDAVGWVAWKRGDAAKAHRYLEASWSWARQELPGDHLARVYQAEGKKEQALTVWAEALSGATLQMPDIKMRFVKEAGSSEKSEELMRKYRLDDQNERSYGIANKKKLNGSAQVQLLVGPGSAVADVQWMSGDERLKAYVPEMKELKLRLRMPDADEIRLLREAIVSCSNLGAKCMVVLTPESSFMRFTNPRF